MNMVTKETYYIYSDSLPNNLLLRKYFFWMLKRNKKRDEKADCYRENSPHCFSYTYDNRESDVEQYIYDEICKWDDVYDIRYLLIGGLRENSPNVIFKNHYSEFHNLRFLDLGCYGYEQYELSWSASIDIKLLLEWFPKLLYLYLKNGTDQSTIERDNSYPEMYYLGIESCGMNSVLLSNLFSNRFDNLIELEIWVGCGERGNDSNVSTFSNLFNKSFAPKLKILRIRNTENINDLLPSIISSPLFKDLLEIDFSFGIIDNNSVKYLINILESDNIIVLVIYEHYIEESNATILKDKAFQNGKILKESKCYRNRHYVAVSE